MKNKIVFVISLILVIIGIIFLMNSYEFAEKLFWIIHSDEMSFDTEYMHQSIAAKSQSFQILGTISIAMGLFPFADSIKKLR